MLEGMVGNRMTHFAIYRKNLFFHNGGKELGKIIFFAIFKESFSQSFGTKTDYNKYKNLTKSDL